MRCEQREHTHVRMMMCGVCYPIGKLNETVKCFQYNLHSYVQEMSVFNIEKEKKIHGTDIEAAGVY